MNAPPTAAECVGRQYDDDAREGCECAVRCILAHWRKRVDNPGGRVATWCAGRSDERVQSVLPRQARATAPTLREALLDLQDTPGYRPGDYGMAVATIHEARFVLFDDDTRLAFITSFDGPWDAYMEDFFTSGPTLALFDVIFRHVEGYDGLPDLAAVKAFVLGAQQTAAAYARNYGGTVKEIRKAQRVNAAFQQVLDHPRRRGGAAAPGAEAAARRGRRLARAAPRTPMSDHISGPRALCRSDRRHHRRLRVPEPGAAGHLVLVMNTLPFAKPSDALSDGLIYRFRLRPLTPSAPGDRRAVRGRRRASSSFDCVFAAHVRHGRPWGFEQEGTCTTPAGETVAFRVNDEDGGRAARRPRLRRPALGPVHHGRPCRAEDDRDREAGVHRPGVDLPRRQERPRASSSSSTRALLGGATTGRRRCRDAAPGACSTSGSSASGGPR